MRFTRLLVLAGVLAAVVVPTALALRFTDDSYKVPGGVVGRPYSHWFKGDGGCGPNLPYQFRVLNGDLPPGLMLRQDGLLSGTPTRAGSWSFWVQLSDQDPPSLWWCLPKRSERRFTVRVIPPAAVGTRYSAGLTAADGGPQTWSIADGQLPSGLVLDSSTGTITGVPEIAGSFPLTFSIVDGSGTISNVEFTFVVSPKLAIATTRLPPLLLGRRYRARVKTSGGVEPVKLGALSGRFPTGVRLDGTTGVLSGTPRQAGVYAVTLRARDTVGGMAKRTFVLTVRRKPS